MTMFTANDDNSMYPKCPRVEITPFATSISMRTPSKGTNRVGGQRYTSSNITDDEDDRHDRDVVQARIGDAQRVGCQRRRAADEDFEPGRRLVLGDDVADRSHRLVGLNLADIAG